MAESQMMVRGKIGEKLVFMPNQHYKIPSVEVGRIFFITLFVELDGVQARKWNYETVIFFGQLSCNAPKVLIIPKIFAQAYCFKSTYLIVGS